MKFKTLTGKEIEFSVDMESETVEQIIQRLEAEASIPASRLVVNGKILNPNVTFQQAEVDVSQFVVIVPPKKKTAAKPKPVEEPTSTPPIISQTTDAQPQAPQEAPQATATPTTPTVTSQPSEPSQPSQPSLSSSSTESTAMSSIPGVPAEELELFENNLTLLTGMGFSRPQAIRCLRASINDVNAATEFLLSGYIPEQLLPLADGTIPLPTQAQIRSLRERQQQAQQRSSQSENPLASLLGGEAPQPESTSNNPIANELQNLGLEFDTIRRAVQQNPQLLEPILQTIQQENPGLFESIQQDPQAFIQLLNEPVSSSQGSHTQGQGGGQGGRQIRRIQITQEEADAISRLEDLGFDRQLAIQAYFSCGRDENAAANILFDHQGEDLQGALFGEEDDDHSGDGDNEEDDKDDDDMDES